MANSLPLSGFTIAVTRPQGQAKNIIAQIEGLGGKAIRFPLLEITALDDKQALNNVAARLQEFQIAIFISPNAVRYGMEVINTSGGMPANLQVATIGQSSAKALHEYGIEDVISPTQRFDSESLLALPELQQVRDKRIVIFRGDKGRELLGDTLLKRGATIEYVSCYHRSNPQRDASVLLAENPDLILVSSSESLNNLWNITKDADKKKLLNITLLAAHERIAIAASQLGWKNTLISGTEDKSLISDLNSWATQKRGKESMNNNDNQPAKVATTPAPVHKNPVGKAISHLNLTQLTLVAAIIVFAWQWFDGKQQLSQMQHILAQRLAETDGSNKATQTLTMQSQEQVRELGGKLSLLESKFAETQNQRIALENLYQDLSSSRDQMLLAEVEQLLLIAGQQLQLSANVKAALIAMQQADSRLQRHNRPSLNNLRQAINRDIEKLRALPDVDVSSLNARLDNLIILVAQLPLVQNIHAQNTELSVATSTTDRTWKALFQEIWSEAKQLVRIENTHKDELPLLSPTQTFFLRENLKLRLLSARLALLSRDESSFKHDIKTAQGWVQLYFDTKSSEGTQALNTLQKLNLSNIKIDLPDISGSLEAVRLYRSSREKDVR